MSEKAYTRKKHTHTHTQEAHGVRLEWGTHANFKIFPILLLDKGRLYLHEPLLPLPLSPTNPPGGPSGERCLPPKTQNLPYPTPQEAPVGTLLPLPPPPQKHSGAKRESRLTKRGTRRCHSWGSPLPSCPDTRSTATTSPAPPPSLRPAASPTPPGQNHQTDSQDHPDRLCSGQDSRGPAGPIEAPWGGCRRCK
jgi:hypothetical protein